MRRILFYIILTCWQLTAVSQKTVHLARVRNTANFNSGEQLVSIPWTVVQAKCMNPDTAMFSVVDASSGNTIAYQFETLGTGKIQNLLLLVSLSAGTHINIKYVRKKNPVFTSRTYGRFVPERKDDFAWENDRIAFRMYGKALQFTNENAYGIDVWVKRTSTMIIDKWYNTADYHTDHGEGLDYYSVGTTLGAGNNTFYWNDTPVYLGNFSRFKVLDNGPLRTAFTLYYDAVTIGNNTITVAKTMTLDAGAQFNRVEVVYTINDNKVVSTVTGIAKRKDAGVVLMDEKKGMMLYWEPTHPQHGTTGVAVIDTSSNRKLFFNNQQLLMRADIVPNQAYTYYTGACWDKAGVITDFDSWHQYINKYCERLKKPLVINY